MPECQSKTIPRGVSFAGMAVFFPVPSGGQLSGMGGQFHRNRGSVWSGINKYEKIYLERPETGSDLYHICSQFIQYYNERRDHSSIGNNPPMLVYQMAA